MLAPQCHAGREYPSERTNGQAGMPRDKGLVFVTGETTGEVGAVAPGGETDLLTVFMPTGIVPPTGFVCFLPRRNVLMLDMNVEDAAKVIISAGMVTPESQAKLKEMAEQVRQMLKTGVLREDGHEMGDLEALKGVSQFPQRVKCAMLPMVTAVQALESFEGNGKDSDVTTE